MDALYTAVVQRDGSWWVGWIKEVPGVNSQARSRDVLLRNLLSSLTESLAFNMAEAVSAATGDFEEVLISV